MEGSLVAYPAAAGNKDENINRLRVLFFSLETRVKDLEGLKLDQRVDSLFRRLDIHERSSQSDHQVHRTALGKLERKIEQLEEQAGQSSQYVRSRRIPRQNVTPHSLAARLSKLEQTSTASSADVDDVAQDLLARLEMGEGLHPQLTKEVLLALSGDRMQEGSDDEDPTKQRTSRRLTVADPSERNTRSQQDEKALSMERDESDGFQSLRRTPSLDRKSAATSKTRAKITATKRKVPETQQQADGDVDMDGARPVIPSERQSKRAVKPVTYDGYLPWDEAIHSLSGEEFV